MNSKLFAACGLLMGLGAVTASAQVYGQLTSNTFFNLVGAPPTKNLPVDTAEDLIGNRYLVGQSKVGTQEVARVYGVSKWGQPLWGGYLGGNGDTYAQCVAVDNYGLEYVAIQDDSGAYVLCFDQFGGFVWITDPEPGVQYTDAIGEVNGVVLVGSRDGQPYFNEFDWFDGSNVGSHTLGTPGSFVSLARNSSGAYYAAGTDATSGAHPIMAYWDPNIGASAVAPLSSSGGTFFDISIDPTTQTAVAVGELFYPSATTYIQSMNCSLDGDNNLVEIDNSNALSEFGAGISTVASNDSVYMSSLLIDDFSIFEYAIGTRKLAIDGPTGAISVVWADTFTDHGSLILPVDLTIGKDGSVLNWAYSSTPFTVNGKTFAGFHQFQYSPDGARINRERLGAPKQGNSTIGYYLPKDLASSSGDTAIFYGVQGNQKITQSVSYFRQGPDDFYRGTEDTPLSVNTKLGVLKNDPNGFSLNPLSAVLVDGSLVGLSSVELDASGSFVATPLPNFHGEASFQYQTMDGSAVLGTHTCVIKFKNVDDAPQANDDTYGVGVNSSTTTLDVTANDTGDSTLHLVARPSDPNAVIGLTPDRTGVTFKPKHGFEGDITFQYTVRDSKGNTSTAMVVVSVGS